MRHVELDLSAVDVQSMWSDRKIRALAEELVPAVLRDVGVDAARRTWDSAVRIAGNSMDAPPAGRQDEFIQAMADRYVRLATPELRNEYRRLIERNLRGRVSGYVSLRFDQHAETGILMASEPLTATGVEEQTHLR